MVQEKYFVRLVKRANLIKLRNGYCARRRVSEARLTGNANSLVQLQNPLGFALLSITFS